jgi:hypothetical protein
MSSSSTPLFSIVIPNWNGKHFLEVCFNAIAAQTEKSQETILVDNGSTDGSLEFCAEKYPWVKVVALPQNLGFAAGVNAGIKVARGEYIILLNNDTEVDPNWLKELKSGIEAHPEASFFACKMLDFKDRTIIDSAGDALTWSGRSYKVGELEKDNGQYDTPRLVFGACGGASVYHRSVFDKIGLFDEDFFAYLEDIDIDFRAQLAGFQCLYLPGARVYHIGSATAGKRSAFSFKLMVRNHWWMILKNFPTSKLIQHAPRLAYAELRLLAAALKYHFGKEWWWAVGDAVAKCKSMRQKRQHIQASRTVPLAYLDSIIQPNFAYKPLRHALKRQPSHHE